MHIIKQNVGVEVDAKHLKLSFQVMLANRSTKVKGSRKFANTAGGYAQIEQWLVKKGHADMEVHLTMEATGVYYEKMAYYFAEKEGYRVHVCLPNTTRAFFDSYNMKSKTDEIDAKGLGLLGLERELEVWQRPSKQMRRLKKLNRTRLQLVKSKTMISNQLHAEQASHEPEQDIVQSYEAHLEFLAGQLKALEQQMDKQISKDKELKEKIDNICQAPGIGFLTAVGVVSELNGFELFQNRNQLVSFCGYDVVKKESGSSVRSKTRISKKGNARVRQMLYMAAMAAARSDKHHKAYYTRIVKKTGIKMKANVAIQRKLLLLIYALFKPGNDYDAKHPEKTRHRIQAKIGDSKTNSGKTKKTEIM